MGINMHLRIYQRWDQVSRRSKHPSLIGHTVMNPYFFIQANKLYQHYVEMY
jgi:hypothetical protein